MAIDVKSHAWEVIHSSANNCWQTPPDLFGRLDREFGFTLDAAALQNSARCSAWLGPDHPDPDRRDALAVEWPRGPVWVNPPYGRGVGDWIAKAALEAANGSTVVVLVMANTDTAYWHDHAWKAAEIRFIRGRVKFLRADGSPAGSAPKGSALLIFRPFWRGSDPIMKAY